MVSRPISSRFAKTSKLIGINYFLDEYRTPTSFLRATDAYRSAPATTRFEADFLARVAPCVASRRVFSCLKTLYIHLTCRRNLAITIRSKRDQFGGVVQLAEVRLQEDESLENALRRFKRKVQQEDIIKEVKRHSFYLKPGEKKRVKEALARKRSRKKARKEQD